jgi:hypothetical protein
MFIVRGQVKALLLRSLLVAVLVGRAIRFINKVTSLQDGVKYDPPLAQPACSGNHTMPD